MRATFNWYLQSLQSRPLVTASVSSFVVQSLGDLLGQSLENCRAVLDQKRVLIQASFGAFYSAPTLHCWLSWLGKRVPGRDFTSVIKKALIHQSLFGPFMIGSYLFIIATVNEGSARRGLVVLKERLLHTVVVGFGVWTSFQLVNFWLVPLCFQIVYLNFVNVFWGAYMSYIRGTTPKHN